MLGPIWQGFANLYQIFEFSFQTFIRFAFLPNTIPTSMLLHFQLDTNRKFKIKDSLIRKNNKKDQCFCM
eukprot:m.52284 g.52284  ORF g.52284 m.52284 type:complete len:69 (-) comp10782_c0_seq1:77-283(-)